MTRDSKAWPVGFVVGLAGFIVGYLQTVGTAPTQWTYMQWLQFASVIILAISGKAGNSWLKGKHDDRRIKGPVR